MAAITVQIQFGNYKCDVSRRAHDVSDVNLP